MYFPWNLRSGLCRFYEPLGDRLRELPNLRSLIIYSDLPARPRHMHGMPWNTVHSILSVPHLREFTLKDLHICPSLLPGEEIHVGSLAPMTSFHYQLHHPRLRWSFFYGDSRAHHHSTARRHTHMRAMRRSPRNGAPLPARMPRIRRTTGKTRRRRRRGGDTAPDTPEHAPHDVTPLPIYPRHSTLP